MTKTVTEPESVEPTPPAARPARDFEVSPKIFVRYLRPVMPHDMPDRARRSLSRSAERVWRHCLADAGAHLYGRRWPFFGFPELEKLDALVRAQSVLSECRSALEKWFDVRVSVSTRGSIEYRDVLSEPWAFGKSQRLSEALHARVRFMPLEQYVRMVLCNG